MLTQTVFDLAYLYQVTARVAAGNNSPNETNMILWYAADMETAYSSSQLVTTLTDQSGNENSASINASFPSVRYHTNALNGKPVFYFTQSLGNAGYFHIKDFGHVTSSLTQSAEYIIVFRSSTDPLLSLTKLGPVMLASASNQGTPALPYLDGKMYELFATTTGNRFASKPTNLSSSFRIFNIVSTTSSFEMIYDGRTIYFDSSSTPNTFGLSAPYQLGKVLNVNGEPWEGMIAEFMVHAPALENMQRDQTYTYLNGKYALVANYTSSTMINPSSSFSDNLLTWLTVDSLVNITTGSQVGVWSSSYGSNHWSSSGTTAALLKGNVLNGRSGVGFNTTTYFTSSARLTFNTNTPFTAISVVQSHTDAALTAHDGTQNLQFRVRRGGTATNGFFCNAAPEQTMTIGRDVGDFQTAVWKRQTSGSNATILMSMPSSTFVGNIAVNQCLASRLGSSDAGIPLSGSICEFIVWDRFLEDWEVFELWRHYIYPKYGL